jgi:outer membrane receptor for ferrienterochelin and colicins
MKKWFVFICFLGLSFLGSFNCLHAQEDAIMLDEVEISSARVDRLLKNSPELVRVVSAAEIEKLNITTVSDALEYVAGVNIETGTGSGFSNRGIASLNGMPAQYTLVLLNGNRILSDHIHSGQNLNFIQVEEIERIEVIKTASSAQYGSDALAGVVNIITKSAKHDNVGHFFGEYGSYNTYKTGASIKTSLNEKLGLYSFVSYNSSDGIPLLAPAHRVDDMAYNSLNLTQRLSSHFDNGLSIDAWMKFIDNTMNFLGEENKSQIFMPNFDLKYHFESGAFIASKLAYSHWKSEVNNENNELFRPEIYYAHPLSDNNHLLVGADFSLHEFTRNKVANRVQRMLGVFVQDEHVFQDKFRILASARLDMVQDLSPVVTPKLALMYDVTDDLKLRLSASRGYHAPSVQELYEEGYGHRGTAYRFGNPDLKPEFNTSIGLGADYHLNQKLFFNVSGFYSDVTNMIVPVYEGAWEEDTTKDVWRRQNILHAQIISGELSVNWIVSKNYQLFLSYNYSDNIANSELAQQLPYNPGQSLHAKFNLNQEIGNHIKISEYVSLRSVYGRSAWNWKPEDGTDTDNPYGLTTELTDYQKLDAGINIEFKDAYKLHFSVNNILGQDIENLDDAFTIIDGEPVYKVGFSLIL